MNTKFATVLALLAAAGCQATPSPFDLLPDPLPRLAAEDALTSARCMQPGDSLEFRWTSNLTDVPQHATIRLTLDEIGTPEVGRDMSDEEIEELRVLGRTAEAELGLPFPFRLLDEDRRYRVPCGHHALSLDVVMPDGSTEHDDLQMPIGCDGHGLDTARRMVHEQIANQGAPLDLDRFFELVLSLYAPVLFLDAGAVAHLPGVDLAPSELVEQPSMLTAVVGWICADRPRIECPFWKPWSTDDGRYLSPVQLTYHGAVLVDGYVEVAPPRGLLAATGGIVGFRAWRPGAPEKYLEARLVGSTTASADAASGNVVDGAAARATYSASTCDHDAGVVTAADPR